MIEKKDWEQAILQMEAMIVNDTLTHEISDFQFDDKINSYKKNIEFCKKRISEFPVEDKATDPMPQEVKDLLPKQ